MKRKWRSRAWRNSHPLSFQQKMKYHLRQLIFPIRAFMGRVALPQQLSYLDYAARWKARHSIEGDYCEFGVYTGRSFVQAYQAITQTSKETKFFAFDSFEGLPQPKDKDSVYLQFSKGGFAATQKEFVENLGKHDVLMSSVKIVPGWFSEVLSASLAEEIALSQVAIALIDCDFYNSTVPVLEFLTNLLVDGSIIIFDDWYVFRGHPDLGPQSAFQEWQIKNPDFRISSFPTISNSLQRAFIIHKPLKNDE